MDDDRNVSAGVDIEDSRVEEEAEVELSLYCWPAASAEWDDEFSVLPLLASNWAESADEPGAEKTFLASPEAEFWIRLAREGLFGCSLAPGEELASLRCVFAGLSSLPRFFWSDMAGGESQCYCQ